MARIYLNTTRGLVQYAKRFGAQFDRSAKKWYCEDLVPPELENLVPKPPNAPSQIKHVHDHLVSAFANPDGTKEQSNHLLPPEWPTIQALLDKQFTTERGAIVWFTTPKIALGHKTPLQVFRTSDGCEKIIRLLETLYD